jgi:hypothetical protein
LQLVILNIYIFFEKVAGALLCHLRRKQLYITSRTLNKTNTPTTTHHQHQPTGREDRRKSSTHAPSSPTLSHAEGATRCSPNNPQSSSTMGLSTSNYTNTIVEPSDPVKLQHTLTTAPGATTGPGHSAWGPRLTHCLSTLPRTQISKTE